MPSHRLVLTQLTNMGIQPLLLECKWWKNYDHSGHQGSICIKWLLLKPINQWVGTSLHFWDLLEVSGQKDASVLRGYGGHTPRVLWIYTSYTPMFPLVYLRRAPSHPISSLVVGTVPSKNHFHRSAGAANARRCDVGGLNTEQAVDARQRLSSAESPPAAENNQTPSPALFHRHRHWLVDVVVSCSSPAGRRSEVTQCIYSIWCSVVWLVTLHLILSSDNIFSIE